MLLTTVAMDAAVAPGMQAVPASVAKMQAKAAQLAAELELAREGLDKPGTARSSSTDACVSPTAAAGGTVRPQSSMAATRRMSQANASGKSAAAADAAAQAALAQCQKLEAQVHMWRNKHFDAERELQRHQESYMRREEQLQARLAELEQRLQHTAGSGHPDSAAAADADDAEAAADAGGSSELRGPSSRRRPPKDQPVTLETVQHQVQHGLEELLQHQRLQLRAEEAAQLRQFRGRLAEVEAQLAADKRAAAADQDSWMSKTLAVREELARTQEIAVKLDAMYKLAEDEAAQLRVQFKAQEDDRQHLIRQVLGLRRQNHHLQQQVSALQEELDAIIMSLEPDDMGHACQDSRPMQLQALQEQLMRHHQQHSQHSGRSSSRPQSAVVGLHAAARGRARPLTAGPASSVQQQEGGRWRPLSGSPQRRPGGTGDEAAAAEAAAAEGSLLQQQQPRQQQSSDHVVRQLQKALQCERKQSRRLRAAYTAELGRRNELQTLLLDSIQQAKQQLRQVQAAHAAQAQAAADTAGVSWQQSGTAAGSSGSSRPGSRMQARQHHRPASAAPYCGGSPKQRQAWSACPDAAAFTAGIASVGSAAADGACEQTGAATGSEGFLDQQAWDKLLNDLLSRQQVFELLLQKACPELVAAAQQLQGQVTAAGAAAAGETATSLQQQEQPEQQQGRAGSMLQPLAEQSREEHDQDDIIEMQPVDIQDAPDMFMTQEDDGDSQAGCGDSVTSDEGGDVDQSDWAAGDMRPQPGEQSGVTGADRQSDAALHEQDFEQQQQQQQQEVQEQEQKPAVQQQEQLLHQEQDLRQQLRQAQDPPHLQHRPFSHTRRSSSKQTAVPCCGSPPPHRRITAGGASGHHGGAAGPPYNVYHPPAGVVTLAAMSGPVMGSFPVRKLLHSASCGSNNHSSQHSHQRAAVRASDSSSCSSSLHRAQQHTQHRRPESAAATNGSRCFIGLGLGDDGLAVRPASAAVTAEGATCPPKHSRIRATHGAWQHETEQGAGDVVQQQPGGIGRPQQQEQRQQQAGRKQLHMPGGVAAAGGASESLSIRSWGSPDGSKGAQLLLKSFLQGK